MTKKQRTSRSRTSLPPHSASVPEPETSLPHTRQEEPVQAQPTESGPQSEALTATWEDVLDYLPYLDEEEALAGMMEGSVTGVATGAYTPGGMSEDMSTGLLPGGGQLGGPSGGDVYGAGEDRPDVDDNEFVADNTQAVGVDKPLSVHKRNTGLASKIAGANTAALLKGLWPPD